MIGKKLQELRNNKNLRQYEIAELMGVSQKSICTLEGKDDLHITMIDKYLRSLGGRLKISAEFPDEGITYELTEYLKKD